MNFFQYKAFLHARVPRVRCPDCGVKLVEIPWAREGSGFTLLFEALVMELAGAMPALTIGQLLGETDKRIWRVLHHYTEDARAKVDMSDVRKVGVDETSSKRAHNYVTFFVDLDQRRLLFATEGKDASTVDAFRKDLEDHGGCADNIVEISCDMSPAFIAGAQKNFPNANITFDKYHLVKVVNDAVDKVRRAEQKERAELKGSRYVWLKNQKNLTKKQAIRLESLTMKKRHLKTARAYQIKLAFQDFWEQLPSQAEPFLKKWYFWATHSRLQPVIDAARTIRKHWDGVLQWFTSRLTNAILEGINSLVQAAKARARGYRTLKNFICISYIIAGRLDFALPT
jgi:transposase